MKVLLASLFLLDYIWLSVSQCLSQDSEFNLAGDFLIGGLFEVHDTPAGISQSLPEAINCSRQPFSVSNYQRFQLMRFSVEQINNSTQLLPGVTLGYETFDHCSDSQTFPGILDFLSVNDSVQPWLELPSENVSKVISVLGPLSSTKAQTVAPLIMMDFIPMVNYGSSSSTFSEKLKFPTFIRTVLTNQQMIEAIVTMLLHFRWHWVAFLNGNGKYGTDGLNLFVNRIKNTEICMAFNKILNTFNNHSEMFQEIEMQKINVIVIFAPENNAGVLLKEAINLKINNKVWIATDAWASNKEFMAIPNISSIGTVIGITEPVVEIPGFHDFIYSLKDKNGQCETDAQRLCNQVCNCNGLSAQTVIGADSSFSFSVYSAVYAVAHALHNVLQCGCGQCNTSVTVYPYMLEVQPAVLAELKKSNFTLLNETIQFNENGDPQFGSYSITFWKNQSSEEVGFYRFYPFVHFYINISEIQWYTNGQVPTSLCSVDCSVGYAKEQNGIHQCCFNCVICPNGTYINITADPYTCVPCKKTEWSETGSTSCLPRSVEYISFSDAAAIVIMVGTVALVGLILMTSVLFALNYNTPVVRSAGGPMCFLILGCLGLCSISVFFYFGEPKEPYCVLRVLPFILFYTVCLACFVVRSFQIVSIFKIAAMYPSIQRWWIKYHGQWLVIAVAFILQVLFLLIATISSPPKLYNETVLYPHQIVLACEISLRGYGGSLTLFVVLCSLCFIFSYMGKDLPKNYNEAKAITFCLFLLILTWIIFATVWILYKGKHLQTLNALAVLSSLYSFLLWYFLPKCCIIICQPEKNTQQYFQGLIQSYTKTISQ